MIKNIFLPILLLASVYFSPLLATCPTVEEVMKKLQSTYDQVLRKNSPLETAAGESWLTSVVPDESKFVHKFETHNNNVTKVEANPAETKTNVCAYNLFYKASAYKSPEQAPSTELLTFSPNPCPSSPEVIRFVTIKNNKPAIGDILEASNGRWAVSYAPKYDDPNTLNAYNFNSFTFLNQNPGASKDGRCAYNVGWPQAQYSLNKERGYSPGLIVLEKSAQ